MPDGSEVAVSPRPFAGLGVHSRQPNHPEEAEDHPDDRRPCDELFHKGRLPLAHEARLRDVPEPGEQRCGKGDCELETDAYPRSIQAPLPTFQVVHEGTLRPSVKLIGHGVSRS